MDPNRLRRDNLFRDAPRPGSNQNEYPRQRPISDVTPNRGSSIPRRSWADWEDVPVPYRPRDWHYPSTDNWSSIGPESQHSWRLRPNDQPQHPPSLLPRQHRRPDAVTESHGRRELEAQWNSVNASLLYPQMSPYDDAASTYSAPDALEHLPRAVSQPGTPSFGPSQPSPPIEPPFSAIPRSPTYPPATRGRIHSAVRDNTFTDDEEFHLFVQATAGLGPDAPFRSMGPPLETRRPGYDRAAATTDGSFSPDTLVSPLQQTPTTIYALQQLAQMPYGSHEPQHRREPQRIATTRARGPSGIDFWLHPPSATEGGDGYEESPIDDELPDYATSQAQAQATQRAEAARRAQELQRRWQQASR